MASGFPTGAYCSKASQTPMSSASPAVSPHLHARARECPALSCWDSWCPRGGREVCPTLLPPAGVGLKLPGVLAGCGRLDVLHGASQRSCWVRTRRRPGTARAVRNLATDPGVLSTDDRAPSSREGGGEAEQRDAVRHAPAIPRHARALTGAWTGLPLKQLEARPLLTGCPVSDRGERDAPPGTTGELIDTWCEWPTVLPAVQRKGTSAHARDPRKATQDPVPAR
jgi:hypothetical protein